MLQYRTTYVNGTPIDVSDDNTSSAATLDQQLRMVEVAQVGGDGTDLEFLEANFSIWLSEVMCIYSSRFHIIGYYSYIGHIPHDGVPQSEPSTVILPVAVTVILLNVGGLAFALFCLVFNIIYRNKK